MNAQDLKLLTVAAIVALGLGLAGCSSSNGGTANNGGTDDQVSTPVEPTPPPASSDLETTQAAAASAAMAAMAASDAAKMSAESAATATVNLATLQTGEMARMHAENAEKKAAEAVAEYMKAKAASEAAAADTVASDAGAERAKAVEARMAAEAARDMAADYDEKASKAAMMELMIDGKDKSVGASMLNAGDGMLTTFNDNDSKTITGRLDNLDPTEKPASTLAVGGKQDDPNDASDKAVAPMVAAEARSVDIGKTIDTRDDMARLMLMTSHAGTKTVKVFSEVTANGVLGADHWTSTKAGQVQVEGTGTPEDTDDVYLPIRAAGTYYPATEGTAGGFTNLPETPEDDEATFVPDGTVGEMAKSETVYVFNIPDDPATANADESATHYVVLHSLNTEGEMTTKTYRRVDTMVELPGVGSTDDGGTAIGLNDVNVMAKLPAAIDYKYLHFGVWANLDDPEKNGSQEISKLGIGFVQNIGTGMTGADMPNAGSATYNGNWAATMQARNAGDVVLDHGTATLTANLDKSTLKADLDGLATLDGMLDGSTFKGMDAKVDEANTYGLASDGDFEGEFSGGFYGPAAAEAAGVFDFASDDSGAFTGAFGGAKVTDE